MRILDCLQHNYYEEGTDGYMCKYTQTWTHHSVCIFLYYILFTLVTVLQATWNSHPMIGSLLVKLSLTGFATCGRVMLGNHFVVSFANNLPFLLQCSIQLHQLLIAFLSDGFVELEQFIIYIQLIPPNTEHETWRQYLTLPSMLMVRLHHDFLHFGLS